MKSTLYLCGAGNHEGIRLALRINEYEARWGKIIILDDDPAKHGQSILGVEVAGPFDLLEEADVDSAEVANMVARTTAKRHAALRRISEYGIPFTPLIDPGVDVWGVKYSNDVMVYPNVTFAAGAFVDEASVVLMGAVVGHGCHVGRCCVVAPGAVINARVQLGDGVYIGTNASILPDLKVGPWGTIGVGSAVIEDVPAGATVMGVPAKILMMPDRKHEQQATASTKKDRPELEQNLAAPRTSMEKSLAELWTEILGIEKVGIDDNFFDLGADSILAVQVVGKAIQAGIQLTVRQLMEHPTIAELAKVASRIDGSRHAQELVTGRVLLTPVQKWLLEQHLPELHYYNQTMLLKSPPDIDLDKLEWAVGEMLKQHDALRMRFSQTKEGWQQTCDGFDGVVPFARVDLSGKAPKEQPEALSSAIVNFQASLNLSEGPIFRAVYFNLGDKHPGRLLLLIHHLAVDGISWRILLEDLQTAYLQSSDVGAVKLPPKTTSFQQWARRLTEHAGSTTALSEVGHWLSVKRDQVSRLPRDFQDGANTEASTRKIITSLTLDETRNLLLKVPAAYNTQINDVLLTALTQAVSKWTGESKLLVDLEGHGREEIIEGVDISRTIGWFTSIFPVVLELKASHTEGEALKSIKEQLHKIPNNGIGYGLLRYLSSDISLTERLQKLPQAEIQFNYLGQFDQMFAGSSIFEAAPEPPGAFSREASPLQPRPYLLEIQGMVVHEELRLTWLYSENLHQRSTIEALANEFMICLRTFISHCTGKKVVELTPSDSPLVSLSQQSVQGIRHFREDDIEQVANLYYIVFRKKDKSATTSLSSYFEEIFFHNPWHDEALPSLVYQKNTGEIIGFLGVIPRRMSINGQPVQALIGTHFMVDPTSRGIVGVQLLKRLFSGQQDMTITDTANDETRKIWEGLGGTTAYSYSFYWTRPLRPCRYTISVLKGNNMLTPFLSVCKPFYVIADAIASRLSGSPFRQERPQFWDESLTLETHIKCITELSEKGGLQPDYDIESLRWLLDKVAQKRKFGNLHQVLVRDSKQNIIGCYLYYLNTQGIGEVIQIASKRNSIGDVLDHLFYHSWQNGAMALHGRVDPRFIQNLWEKSCFFDRSGDWTLIHSGDPEILQVIMSGNAALTRLEGDWWLSSMEV